MRIALFEDPSASNLDPLTLARPAYLISCAGSTLLSASQAIGKVEAAYVRPYLRNIELADRGLGPNHGPVSDTTMLINASLVPSTAAIRTIGELYQRGEPCVVRVGSRIALAVVPEGAVLPDDPSFASEHETLLDQLSEYDHADFELSLLEYPHNVVEEHLLHFGDALEARVASDRYTEIADGVFAADANTKIDTVVRCDTTNGPIVLEANVSIGPFTYIRGPVHIGANSIINEHSAIKDKVWIGNNCKVGGEVEETTIEPYSNKQHHGFLGHSYIGSWVNLGAGTCNSDLKNTYGHIRIEYDQGRRDTGMQFLGCMVGDYTKSAINTSIFTGKVIGACSMLYGFITTNVPSFANYARTFGQVTELPDDVLIDTQRRMFRRRRKTQREVDVQLIRDMYELVRQRRQLVEERLSL